MGLEVLASILLVWILTIPQESKITLRYAVGMEMLTIYKGTVIEIENNLDKTWIISDSLSALQTISSVKVHNIDRITAPVKNLISENSVHRHVSFLWVPGHSGIRQNEIADKLVEFQTLYECRVDIFEFLPMFRCRTLSEFQSDWKQQLNFKGSSYRLVQLDFVFKPCITNRRHITILYFENRKWNLSGTPLQDRN